jgi:hypothetical protein
MPGDHVEAPDTSDNDPLSENLKLNRHDQDQHAEIGNISNQIS